VNKAKLPTVALIIACAAPAWASNGVGKGVNLRTTDVSEMCFVGLPMAALLHNSSPSKPCWSEDL